MRKITVILGLLALNTACSQQNTNTAEAATPPAKTQTAMKTLHDFKVKDLSGKEYDFAALKGKKVMIVNTASECGLTPQYENLEALYKAYGGDKFMIVGFPCNDFGSQEPGTNDQIAQFCTKNYGVTFPMMDKISVKGDAKADVYKWLTQKDQNGVEDTEVSWNFQKYLIDENGNYVKMIDPRTLPDDPEVVKWIKG